MAGQGRLCPLEFVLSQGFSSTYPTATAEEEVGLGSWPVPTLSWARRPQQGKAPGITSWVTSWVMGGGQEPRGEAPSRGPVCSRPRALGMEEAGPMTQLPRDTDKWGRWGLRTQLLPGLGAAWEPQARRPRLPLYLDGLDATEERIHPGKRKRRWEFPRHRLLVLQEGREKTESASDPLPAAAPPPRQARGPGRTLKKSFMLAQQKS